MSTSALIFGATGLVGSHVLQNLLDSDRFDSVSAVGRRSCGVQHPKLVEHLFDLTDLEKHEHLIEADAIFCCLGTTIKKAGSKGAFRKIDHDYVLNAATYGLQNGAKQFYLVTSIGAKADSRIFYLQVKGEIEESVSKLGYQSVLIFRPAGLLGSRNEFRLGEKIGNGITKLLSPLMIGPLRKSRPIKAKHVAYVMTHLPTGDVNGTKIYTSDEIQHLYNSMVSTGKQD